MKTILRLMACSLLVPMLLIVPARADLKITVGGEDFEIESFSRDGMEYLSLVQLSRVLGGVTDWSIPGQAITYTTAANRFEFMVNSPYFRLNDSLYNLTYSTEYRDGDLYLPAETFLPYLDRVSADRLEYDRRSSSVSVEKSRYTVTDLAISARANGLLIEIFLAEPLAYDIFVTEGNWINVSIRNARVDVGQIESRLDKRMLHQLKAIQEQGVGQISLQVRKSVKTTHHKLVSDPPRIQISIPDVNFDLDSVVSVEEPAKEPATTFDGVIDVIAIDAGHGGKDYGAIGPDKTREKDVALAMARKLAEIVRADGLFKVIMTRNSDTYISLQERADIANRGGADLFISIHANANPSRKARGWNVFFLAPAKNDSARAVEQLENSYFIREMQAASSDSADSAFADNPIMGILNDMLMTEFQAESHDFAMMIDRQFRRRLETPARGVDQAGFFVLNKVFTPSVLIESAFISNRTEVKLLKSPAYQTKVATGIYEAIREFADKYNAASTMQ